jgi:UDP-glucose 4-epimerase
MELFKRGSMNKNILVIAGSGFLGKNILRSLRSENTGVIACLDVADPGIEGVKFQQLNLLEATINDIETLIKDYDLVINCSGQITNPINACYRLNTEGIKKIADVVKRSGSFLIHLSTVTVYGSCAEADELTAINPETSYSAAKAFAEYIISTVLSEESYCILRLSNLYGDTQPKGVFSYIKRSYNSDRKLEFNNDGYMLRYYLHVNDCVDILLQIVNKGKMSGIYNLIGPDKYTLRQLVAVAEETGARKFDTTYDNIKSWDNTLNILDNKIKNNIELSYKRSIPESFKIMFENN